MSKKINQQFLCSKMMLPEHYSDLRKHAAGKQWTENHRRPHLDEQFQEELQQILEQALSEQKLLKIITLNSKGYRVYSGIPLHSDPSTGLIWLGSGKCRPQSIRACEVISIEPVRLSF